MSLRESEEHLPQLEELSLDGTDGPALPLDEYAFDGLIATALDRALSPVSSVRKRPGRVSPRAPGAAWSWPKVAAAVLLLSLSAFGASAAVMWWPKTEELVLTSEELSSAYRTEPRRIAVPIQSQFAEASAGERRLMTKRTARELQDWLDEANRLRAQARWDQADRMYARVWESAPSSPAAYVARVAAATVRLEQLDDPKGALVSFRAALAQAPLGVLSEEVRYGIAEAHRRLKHHQEEQKALDAFLRLHPDAVFSARARARRDELMRTGTPEGTH